MDNAIERLTKQYAFVITN